MNQSAFISPHITGLLANRYQLKQLIGSGGMGEVFLADDILLGGTPVAVKFLTQTFCDEKMQQDFAREAMLSAALSQKSLHIVRAYDYGVSAEGKPFYVMEYLNGKSLKDLIPMPIPKFLTLTRQICLGLQCAHQGINIDGKIYQLVHRDVKPANILVLPDPILGRLIKILDFGIAKFINYTNSVNTNKGFHGTLPYCSPEQLEGTEIDSRSDIYSLGVMMFEMLTGAKPWQPETDLFGAWYKAHNFEAPKSIATVSPQLKLPQQLNNLIMACLAKKPSDRPQNMTEILQVLDSLEKSSCQSLPTPLASQYNPSLTFGADLPPVLKTNFEQLRWPQNKPIQEIVFPQVLDQSQGNLPALWLMLPKQEIKKRVLCQRYNHFVFITAPHPMLLWITLLHDPEIGSKWLPCYLDMQNPQNQELVSRLIEHGRYSLICFTLEAPHSCVTVLNTHIINTQRQRLKQWIEQSKSQPQSDQALNSKNLLKQQYKQIQVHILEHLSSKSKIVTASTT
ncbi:serine/threonine kinase [Nostoc sp. HK-01]|uniref:Serine/threonine protein kinase n=1 Tax=Nostoc cycadae WK-1 TaxID=1861711 RepID=A0A2H6LLF3_9NOSO|nr:serine/threonine-protein kinase [Nostoc cycadae]BBD61579.1 serine/threonine kinase [Nostoc sp. HK-01]GBE94049.1 serine/threonine protein kinase [Nostoc cycadae WK-1]